VYEILRQQAECKEAVLVTWGALLDGSKVPIHISLGRPLDSLNARRLPLTSDPVSR
jgi:hypothetical protein